jgi:putative oxidoreductase
MNSLFLQRLVYAVLRVMATFVYMQHGAQKLFGAFGGFGPGHHAAPLFSLFGLAGVIEFFLGMLVLVGLLTRPAAFIMSGEMAAAYFIAHQPKGALPIQNGGELAVLYAFVFLYIAARGSGTLSVDGGK